jgi:hypothetical protein
VCGYYSQQNKTDSYPEPQYFSPQYSSYFCNTYFNIIFPFMPEYIKRFPLFLFWSQHCWHIVYLNVTYTNATGGVMPQFDV